MATSPAMIAMMKGLDRIGGRIILDAANSPNGFETTVNAVQDVTDVVLQPLAQ